MDIVSSFITFIQQYGYIPIMIGAFLEGASVPIPSSPVLVFAGFLIYKERLNFSLAILLVTLSYSIASILPYYIGKKLGEGLFDFLESRFKVPREKIEYMKAVFHKYGDISVCITRSFFVGNYISYFAGAAGIHIIKYFTLTFIGILPWPITYMMLGYIFRGNLQRVNNFLDQYNIFGILFFVSIGVVILLILWRRYRDKKI